MFTFKTKASTLDEMANLVTKASVLPQFIVIKEDWKNDSRLVLDEFYKSCTFAESKLVVRSSAMNEDQDGSSMAGRYTSVLNVEHVNLPDAIDQVFESYEYDNPEDQVLIQPMLNNVVASGVAFSLDPNTSAKYFVINYDDFSGSTDSVTSGKINTKSYYYHHTSQVRAEPTFLNNVIDLMRELMQVTKQNNLDVEFALDDNNELYLFQVRPLFVNQDNNKYADNNEIERVYKTVANKMAKHPHLLGDKAIFGVMPDWNPAEMIGIRPDALALSLYRTLITDSIWAYQRNNYGYMDLRSFPLMLCFGGTPFIDTRVSFNSFIPKTLDHEIANKLVNYYTECLEADPSLHDKVEFKIVFSCYSFDVQDRIQILKQNNFNDSEIEAILLSLLDLTNNILHGENAPWKQDYSKIEILEKRRDELLNSNLDTLSKLYWLIEDTKRYGTLPFAGLARAGFIAVQLLNSLVNVGVISTKEKESFMLSINSVSSQMTRDLHQLPKQNFLQKYGHLRPGTYDINSYRYDEKPDLYFEWENIQVNIENDGHEFSLSIPQIKKIDCLLRDHNIKANVIELFDFITTGIEGREYAKFIFTKNVSDYLSLLEKYCENFDISREDCAYISVDDVMELYYNSYDPKEFLTESIAKGKQKHSVAKSICLPPLICNPEDVYAFHIPDTQPNFVTQLKTRGNIAFTANPDSMKNAIVLIPSADPGFDWIFTYNIKGFITQYGGANSHMAIRAGELSIPAAIGVGEKLYQNLTKAKNIELDCLNNKIIVL